MARQIRKDKNGKYKVYSTICEEYIMRNATPEEIIERYVEDYRREVTEDVMRECKYLEEVDNRSRQ